MGWLGRKAPLKHGTRIFFATDIHGSDTCFRKFLNASKSYGCPCLVLGGDITGKVLVPIVRGGDGTYSCSFGENEYSGLDEAGRAEIIERIRRIGHYTIVVTEDEWEQLADPVEQDRAFRKAVYESVADWVALADERLRGTERRCYVAPGNDDFLEIDGALQGSDYVVFAENQRLMIDDVHEMVTTGYSNLTPWETERELSEEDLRQRIDAMSRDVSDPSNLIAVLHPPPYDTILDQAPRLNESLAVTVRPGSGVVMTPVGSTAVRSFIEDTQPLLGLHGHVHESPGAIHLGRTLCINPGSEYTRGGLAGAIVEVGAGEVLRHQLLSG
jgi:Icc-related predicted phosphoesterase